MKATKLVKLLVLIIEREGDVDVLTDVPKFGSTPIEEVIMCKSISGHCEITLSLAPKTKAGISLGW